MSRIQKAYETMFREALRKTGARRGEQGVAWLLSQARRRSAERALPLAKALNTVYQEVISRTRRRPHGAPAGTRFACDAGLGGLARWLRAAGFEADWRPHISDEDLLAHAQQTSAILLTTDSLMMERRLLRHGAIPSLWLPPSLSIAEQLAAVFTEFNLQLGIARCMACGGDLRKGDKEALRDRIPPRTYRWLDEYFVCTRCDRLYWHGTHWDRIQRKLQETLPAGGS